jgi:putative MATE family efflux protein
VRRLDERDRRILNLAVPALATLAVEPIYVLVDTAIVGHLGTAPLGGLALAATVLSTLTWIFNFLSFGTTSRVAYLTGRGDHRGAAGVAAQGLWLGAVIGTLLAGVVYLVARPIAGGLGGHGAVLDAAVTYLRISAVGVPAILITLVGQGHLRGLSDTRTPFRVVIVANVLNLVLEVVLVYGFHFGVAGSAWGTVVAQVLAAVWFMRITGRRVLAADVTLRPQPREMRRLVVIGRHLFFRTAALLAALTLATSVAARVGQSTLAAHQIVFQIFLFLALVLDALAVAAQATVGTDLGAGSETEARAMGTRTVIHGVLFGTAIGAVLAAGSTWIPRLFTSDAAVVHRATAGLVILGIMQVPAGVAFALDGVLMGASDFRFLQWTTISGLVVFAPVAVAVLTWHRLGIVGIWLGLLAWMTTRTAVTGRRFLGPEWTSSAHA